MPHDYIFTENPLLAGKKKDGTGASKKDSTASHPQKRPSVGEDKTGGKSIADRIALLEYAKSGKQKVSKAASEAKTESDAAKKAAELAIAQAAEQAAADKAAEEAAAAQAAAEQAAAEQAAADKAAAAQAERRNRNRMILKAKTQAQMHSNRARNVLVAAKKYSAEVARLAAEAEAAKQAAEAEAAKLAAEAAAETARKEAEAEAARLAAEAAEVARLAAEAAAAAQLAQQQAAAAQAASQAAAQAAAQAASPAGVNARAATRKAQLAQQAQQQAQANPGLGRRILNKLKPNRHSLENTNKASETVGSGVDLFVQVQTIRNVEGPAKALAAQVGIAADTFGLVGAALSTGLAVHDLSKSKTTTENKVKAGSEIVGGVADFTRYGASVAKGVAETSGHEAAAHLAPMIGGAAIAGGAVMFGAGAYGEYKARKRLAKVAGVEHAADSMAGDDKTNLMTTAQFGRNKQGQNQDSSRVKMVKGAIMIAGGATILAAAASPAGWVLLGIAGLVGIGYLAYKHLWVKAKEKEKVVDRYYDIDKKFEDHKTECAANGTPPAKSKEEFRLAFLGTKISVAYDSIVTLMAQEIHQKGVLDSPPDPNYVTLIKSLDLKLDADHKPTEQQIAKKIK